MRIRRLEIKNFRAITSVKLTDLEDTIVIAGQNGCGKSCIFDAIRLVKSVYGGYQQDEWQQWFGEFQINIQRLEKDVKALFQDKNKPVKIGIEFALSAYERDFIRENAQELISASVWQMVLPDRPGRRRNQMPAADIRRYQPEVDEETEKRQEAFLKCIEDSGHIAELKIDVNGTVSAEESPVLELCFSTYDPANIGIVDFHGANRQYDREAMGGINLNIEDTDQRYKQHIMYNYREKYKNIKSELAAAYIRDLIAFESNPHHVATHSILGSLQDLFRLFFPGKSFLGPQATSDGRLGFPVQLENGASHDINELSSGEKEILYGYLRLQNTSPRNSIVLLDEPELHLNPRLVRGLPMFYQKHLGQAKNNQIWLATHSDAFLRSAVGEPGFSVFHMRSPLEATKARIQLGSVSADDEVEAAIFDLVGDLAAYSPGGKLIIFEGGGDTNFDVRFVSDIFPELLQKANLISGENKPKARLLHQALEKAFAARKLRVEVYSVTDRDSDDLPTSAVRKQLTWNVYHIKNYLLSDSHIALALSELHSPKYPYTPEWVASELHKAATSATHGLVEQKIRKFVNERLIACFDFGVDPGRVDKATALHESASRSVERVNNVLYGELSLDMLDEMEKEVRKVLKSDLEDDSWRKSFMGREVLKEFVRAHGRGISYNHFRNLIIARMKSSGYQPPGMKAIIDAILN